MSGRKLYWIKDKKEISLSVAQNIFEHKYPSQWFEENSGKPFINYFPYKEDVADLKKSVIAAIKGTPIPAEVFVSWVIQSGVVGDEPGKQDWTSFGRTVCTKTQEKVGLKDIVDLNKMEDIKTLSSVDGSEDYDDFVLLILGLSVYRIHSNEHTDHHQTAIKRINSILAGIKNNDKRLVNNLEYLKSWTLCKEYRKLVAAIDMLYYNRPESEKARCRVCTLGSRYKGCAAYLCIGWLCSIFNLSDDDFLLWIWHESVARQLRRCLKEGEEMNEPTSYAPYQMDLDLVMGTQYSSSMNKELYNFTQFAGALRQEGRSKNAFYTAGSGSGDLMMVSALLCYAMGSTVKIEQQFQYSDDTGASLTRRLPRAAGEKPSTRDGSDWFCWVRENNMSLPREVVQFFKACKSSLGDSRDKSIGRFVYEFKLPEV